MGLFKTEPHIEIEAENYLRRCYQRSIRWFIENNMKYIFLLTKCRNKRLKRFYGEQFIVGYIERREVGQHRGHYFVKGEVKIAHFEESYPILNLFNRKLSRRELLSHRYYVLDSDKTAEIIQFLKNSRNILRECVEEIKRLDPCNKTCHYAQDPGKCMFFQECLRFKE